MDIVQSPSLAGGLAWASGIRLYAVLFSAGLLGNLGYLALPATLQPLENPWVIGIAGALFAVEFLADKIPIVDSIWDGIQTFIRIPAGAVLAALAMGEHPPELMLVAGLLGGSIALQLLGPQLLGRFVDTAAALINTSPEPFSNVAASLGEEAMVAGGLYAAIYHPVVFLIILGGFVILLIWLLPKLIRGIRMLFGRLFRPSRST